MHTIRTCGTCGALIVGEHRWCDGPYEQRRLIRARLLVKAELEAERWAAQYNRDRREARKLETNAPR